MGAINFYLKKPEAVSGKSLIFLQWKYRGQRLVFSTGENIDPGNWNYDKQEVKDKKATLVNSDYLLNDLLKELKTQCELVYKNEIKNGIPTPAMLRTHLRAYMDKHINAEKQVKYTIWDLISRFTSGEVRDKFNHSKSDGTLRHYKTVRWHLQNFNKKYNYNLSFENINQDFLDKYLNYLEKDAKLSLNTIAKNLQTLKLFMKTGFKRGYHKNSWYEEISVSWEESENVALSRREINKLYNHDFSDDSRLERVRDLFVFGCNVGLRISDFSNIKAHNIIDVDGEKRLKVITKKNKTGVEIPCNDQVLEILKKYNDILPKISDQKFNDYIKESCEEAGLTATGRLLKTPDVRLCDCISSHTCRRSFCTNLYNEGVSPVVIMKISGHKTETAFLKYIKVSQTDAADKLSAHFRDMKQSKLKAV